MAETSREAARRILLRLWEEKHGSLKPENLNSQPSEPQPDKLHQSDPKEILEKPAEVVQLSHRPISVKLPVNVDEFVRALPEPSEWLRRVISEAVERELKGSSSS